MYLVNRGYEEQSRGGGPLERHDRPGKGVGEVDVPDGVERRDGADVDGGSGQVGHKGPIRTGQTVR